MTLDPYLGIEVWCDIIQNSVYQSVARLPVTVREITISTILVDINHFTI